MFFFRVVLLIINAIIWMIVHSCIVGLYYYLPSQMCEKCQQLKNNIIEYSIVYILFLLLSLMFYWKIYKEDNKYILFFIVAISINLFLFFLAYKNFLDLANSVA